MKLTPEILEKYYQGVCSEEENRIVEAWLSKEELDDHHIEIDKNEQKETWESIQTAQKNNSSQYKWSFFKYVAAILIFVLVSSVFYHFLYPKNSNFSNVENSIIAWDTVNTQLGERVNITLSDGTEVLLNFNSKISFPKKFTNDTRTVFLDGEAFFHVKKDPSHPFIIHTHDKSIKVLGTKFSVDAYNAPHKISVTVKEGKVKFYNSLDSSQGLILTKGQRGEFLKQKGFTRKDTNNSFWLNWTNDQPFTFKNTTINDIAISLSEVYGTEFKIDDRWKQKHFTGNFDRNATLESIIQRICFVMNCNYKITENYIQIY
jgi:transmembrane sensor